MEHHPTIAIVLVRELERVAQHCTESVDLRGVENGVQSSDRHIQPSFLYRVGHTPHMPTIATMATTMTAMSTSDHMAILCSIDATASVSPAS